MKVRPAVVIVLVRDRAIGQRLTAALRPMPVHVIHEVAALHTMLEPRKTEWNGYTISLVTLTPVRMASTPVDPAAYRAQLLVTR